MESSVKDDTLRQPQQNGESKKREETMSPGSPTSGRPKLQLPMSVDPPGLNNPPKQLVWVVRSMFSYLRSKDASLTN